MKSLGCAILLACTAKLVVAQQVTTQHKVRADGAVISYRATAGYIGLKSAVKDTAKDEGLRTTAEMFFVAYTRDDARDIARRPITFVFNGGPGSSAIWLHLGGLGPRRVALSDEGEAPAPPYRLVDNESTWLDETDLVFVDPVSTGYSRPAPGEDAAQFFGYKGDVRSTGEFIYRYLVRERRWASPKFIAGESYGSLRAAALAEHLQGEYGLYLNGLMLISPALNYRTFFFTPQNDEPFVSFLPTYAAAAWYHGKLDPQMQAKSVVELTAQARAYADRDFVLALRQGDELSGEERRHVAQELERFTSVPSAYYERRQLRVPAKPFLTQLLKKEGRIAGRFDARHRGLPYELDSEQWDYDPTNEAMFPPVSAAFQDYIRGALQFISERVYKRYGGGEVVSSGHGVPFDGFLNAAEDLRKAMIRNPYLKVWASCGYYDFATPFFSVESTIRSMNLPSERRRNVSMTYYEAGHSFYIHEPSRLKLKKDLQTFLAGAVDQPLQRTIER